MAGQTVFGPVMHKALCLHPLKLSCVLSCLCMVLGQAAEEGGAPAVTGVAAPAPEVLPSPQLGLAEHSGSWGLGAHHANCPASSCLLQVNSFCVLGLSWGMPWCAGTASACIEQACKHSVLACMPAQSAIVRAAHVV